MDKHEKLISLLEDFNNAMLVTRTSAGELDARPMAIADVEENGTLWFVSDRNSGKIADLMLDQDVAVTMQSSNKFVSVTGKCQAVEDRQKVDDLWNEAFKVWFPEGKSDPSIILLRIDPARGEYWDNSGLQGIKYLVKAGKAYWQGERPTPDASINAAVTM
ncbi:pyridoxamine 5'-phosphate oxidase family protein [Roseiconus lacunae]|uniref:Pyridoxamine 5'-phosphate oxidase family protein n=1 Tax=Roseiconus lacunae TaxID=2605694 RepID=A0ABT7PQ56_9BACT|nr:pyridoxamine 5'-phosphate oxidase family protein [Roseiconus lacunae]MCD0462815.1 pyridoxamine 5'-phosphate oxidase family protein [Roseiconus lacunae]MDM4018639.1 pyridoxamine 5'-phosphate oxidase family protein [Roseiconus lacunae]WRQ51408.1 pyridoxamine 5'-phosphate oxidase family protein [Stieleria sp. HD01]